MEPDSDVLCSECETIVAVDAVTATSVADDLEAAVSSILVNWKIKFQSINFYCNIGINIHG